MEQRALKHHRERLGEAIREEIGAILEGELGDPRIGLVTVSEVMIASNGKSAIVLVAVAGEEQEAVDTLEGLAAATGYIRHEVAARLGLRVAPELLFRLDQTERYGGRVEELLKRVNKRKKSSR
ncbi:ribosome-binding factor A [Candidatus Koribacter versatilis Ellin345]|uniref:Ribosome-binding factor A n=1 Tax=Koribacter versatilis (strain Ellin345) TaxID=204669 RepID=RBFA_KORVE|nr:30S ribosome-binding factor RbfA [Candidatus Koribacter versatilis]Q1IIT5.1 RecName: Full=Ribosome-binding factor A [Candidatus Koribacter versatilis Ellin345]ABF43215.1 ribosome-binding factor A [Candidatus Koribacter versatilis Ellin345]